MTRPSRASKRKEHGSWRPGLRHACCGRCPGCFCRAILGTMPAGPPGRTCPVVGSTWRGVSSPGRFLFLAVNGAGSGRNASTDLTAVPRARAPLGQPLGRALLGSAVLLGFAEQPRPAPSAASACSEQLLPGEMTATPVSLSLAASLHPPARSWGEAGRLLVPGVWSLPGVLPGKEHSTKNPTEKRPRIGGNQPLGRVPPLVAVQTSQKADVPSASRNGLGPGRQAGTGPCLAAEHKPNNRIPHTLSL